MRQIVFFFLSCVFLFSCEKKELPVSKREVTVRTGGVSMPGELIEMQVAMGSDYKNQIWFSLNHSNVISTNFRTEWDLAFESTSNGYHIMLNGSKAMKAYKTNFSSLAEVNDTAGLGSFGKADMPSGNLDSTAIGNWLEENKVYVLHRGYNEIGQVQGFYKFKVLSVNATQFTFEYANIKNPQIMQGTVNKDKAYNFRMYSFTSNQEATTIEPKKDTYDLCFTQYTHYFIEEKMFYQVTGALINNFNTRAMRITNKKFTDITINDTLNRAFSVRRDKIGYDWKEFNLNTNIYKIFPDICYLISDSKGFFYKLHFIDFVNSSGTKGYPSFQFQKL